MSKSRSSAIETLKPIQLHDVSRDLHVTDALLFPNESGEGFVMTLVSAGGSVNVMLSDDMLCELTNGLRRVWKLNQVQRYGDMMLSECRRSIHLLNDDDAQFIKRLSKLELTQLSEADQKRLYALAELARRRARREQEGRRSKTSKTSKTGRAPAGGQGGQPSFPRFWQPVDAKSRKD
jgi:hypothetical protein